MSSRTQLAVAFEALPAAFPAYPQWYAIRTRSRHEKIVSEQLQWQGIENFLPLVKRTRQWTDRIKEVELPLFSGYSFVRMVFSSPQRLRVLKTHGVVGFVGINHAGSPIPDNQIRDIQTVLTSHVPFEEHPCPKIGERVRIRGGCLDGVEGVLESHNGDQSLTISVEPIQRSLSIRIRGYQLEAA
jgi:transcription antitermination factor NusG